MRWISVVVTTILLLGMMSCAKPSPSKYAEKFCRCSEDLGKAEIQLKNKQIDVKAYASIKADQKVCMGEDNPLEQFKNAEDSLKFMANFLKELKEKCPSTARNLGYEID